MSAVALNRQSFNRTGARGKPKETMKAYTFTVAPCISEMLPQYDTIKIGNAVESHGNDNLKIVDTTDKSSNGYKAAKTSASGKITDSASTAVNTKRIKMEGDGSPQRQFAAWHDDTVKMVGKYGTLAACPLPVVLRTWLDAKFKGSSKAVLTAPKARQTSPVKPATIAPAVAVHGNGAIA